MGGALDPNIVKQLAREGGFELAGIARAESIAEDFAAYQEWAALGMAGEMRYLTDRRAEIRRDPGNQLDGAKSVICVGKLYNRGGDSGVFSRYAQGRDYHEVLREGLEALAVKLSALAAHSYKVCVDTAPLLERSYARQAGLGWIGKNTCVINEPQGSWFFLGELVTTLEIENDAPPPDRCGTCTRCIDACPTQALVPNGERYQLDARACISYLNVELRGPIPEDLRTKMGTNVFGCDICQQVCPWNSRAPETDSFDPLYDAAATLESLAELTEAQFRETFRHTPVMRTKYAGFMRNVAVGLVSLGSAEAQAPLEKLAEHPVPLVAEHARWALKHLAAETSPISECV